MYISQKKINVKKNKEQLGILDQEYFMNKGEFSQKRIKALSKLTGLKVKQIYKWIWDKKNTSFKVNEKHKHGIYYKGSNPFVVLKNQYDGN